MSRTGITFEDVKRAIAELQGQQRNPTVDNVRDVLGTGSKSTLARLVREWKMLQGRAAQSDGHLPDELLALVKGLWDSLCQKTDDQITAYRQETDIKIEAIQQELVQSQQMEVKLKQDIHLLEEQLHQKTQEASQLHNTVTIETQEKIKMTERLSALDARWAQSMEENQRLHQLLKHVQENLEHYQAAMQKQREEQSLFLEKKQQEHEAQLSQLLTKVHIEASEKSAIQAKYDYINEAQGILQSEHKALSTQYAALQGLHAPLILRFETLEKQHAVQILELMTLKESNLALRLSAENKEEKIISLEKQIQSAKDKIETLRHEGQFLLQEKAGLQGQLKQIQTMLPA